LHRHRLVGDRALVAGAAAWLAGVLALFGVLAWTFDTPQVAHPFLLLMAMLAVPLVRPAVVLLALASNRHRGTVPPSPESMGRTPARRAALVLLAAPLALAAVLLVSFEVRNRDNGRLVSGGDA